MTITGYRDSGSMKLPSCPCPSVSAPVIRRLHEVGVLVDESLTHPGGVLLIDAENDRFLETVPAFLQKLRDFPGYELGPVIQNQGAVEILGVVDSVLDLHAVPIHLPLLWAVAFHIAVNMHLDDLVGGEETVLDALFQGIGIDRLTEIMDVRNVFGFLGRGGQSDLRGRREVFENLPPGRILGRAAAMALVDHDEIEEAGR